MAVEALPDMQAILSKLSDFDGDVLRTACGDDRLTGWGAAVSEVLEHLQDNGLIECGLSHKPTKLGYAVARCLAKEVR